MKKEEVHLVKYFDFNTARLAIFEYIEAWYNRKRKHSSIGYISSQKCEDLARRIAFWDSNSKINKDCMKLLTVRDYDHILALAVAWRKENYSIAVPIFMDCLLKTTTYI